MTASTETAPAPRTRWAWAVATCLGLGYLRPGPGTWTSAVVLLGWALLGPWTGSAALYVAAAGTALLVAAGIPAAGVVERESGGADPSHITIDEAAGQMLTFIAVPLSWKYLLVGFILFRGFDVLKPPPLRRLERLHGGAGVMLDDLGAGVYAWLVLQALVYFAVLG